MITPQAIVMRVLVTAGNTLVPIDRVRCITNIFTGRTGTRIALGFYGHGHSVHLLTSHPQVVAEMQGEAAPAAERWTAASYRTFDELHRQMESTVRTGGVDVIIHSAAVSDYRAAGIFAPAPGSRFDAASGRWEGVEAGQASLVDRSAGKVKSDEAELWLRLVRTPKLIDLIRKDWGFEGILVKFKLEVGVDDVRLLEIAERSRRQSGADLIVANTLDGAASWAFLGPFDGEYQRVSRRELGNRLIEAVERLYKEPNHG
jgi:phosphopantothenoylcysteine synthetase/decarboxylase